MVWCDKHKAVNYRSERQFSHELARQMKTARIVNNKMSAVSQAMAVTGLLLLYVVRALVRLRTERIRTQIFNFQFTSQSIIPRLFGDEADSFGFFLLSSRVSSRWLICRRQHRAATSKSITESASGDLSIDFRFASCLSLHQKALYHGHTDYRVDTRTRQRAATRND